MEDLVQKHLNALRELTDAGYSLVIFTPEEMGDDINPDSLGDYLIGMGNDYIAEFSRKV
jgi:hypothetical protein